MLGRVSSLDEAAEAARLLRDAEFLVAARRDARDRAVRAALGAGFTERDLAQACHLAPSTVHKVASSQSARGSGG